MKNRKRVELSYAERVELRGEENHVEETKETEQEDGNVQADVRGAVLGKETQSRSGED